MKKTKLIFIMLAMALSCNPLFGRLYLGIEGGWTGFNTKIEEYQRENGKPIIDRFTAEKLQGGFGNLTIGTEHFFANNYFGLRWGLWGGYGVAQGKVTKYNLNYIGANFDLMVNFVANESVSFGTFSGVEYAFTVLRPDKVVRVGQTIDGTDFYASNQTVAHHPNLRAGLSLLLAQNHRLELMAKFPIKAVNQVSSNQSTWIVNGQPAQNDFVKYAFRYDFLQVFASYKYVF